MVDILFARETVMCTKHLCSRTAKRARWMNARSCVKSKRVAITSLLAMAKLTASIKRVSGAHNVASSVFVLPLLHVFVSISCT